MQRRQACKFAFFLTLSLLIVSPAHGSPIAVNSLSNIYLAAGANSTLGGLNATLGATFAAGSLASMRFSVTGTMSAGPICPTTGPDGDATASAGSGTGAGPGSTLSGISYNAACVMPLLGVFLGPTLPPTTPPALDFTSIGYNFTSLAPVNGQIFFIGDGLTGTGTGLVQTFLVPSTATQLYFGVVDCCWFDNSGGYAVTILSQPAPVTSPVPEPATVLLTSIGLVPLVRRIRK